MSKVGKKPIIIPDNVQVKMDKRVVSVKGEKGEISQMIPQGVVVNIKPGRIELGIEKNSKQNRALWGTIRSLLQNMVTGVGKEWQKALEVSGTGYRAEVKNNDLELIVGFSHPVNISPPAGIVIEAQNNEITVRGADKQKVGQVAAQIRKVRPPDPYKGKGIRYKGEVVRLKPGKAARTTEA